jgi:DNA-binding NtrC family response regulator
MNGFDLLRQIRERAPDIPVILITGYGSIEMARDALKQAQATSSPSLTISTRFPS